MDDQRSANITFLAFALLWGVAAVLAFTLAFALALALLIPRAHARDLGQWDDHSPEIRAWFQALMQPDTVGMGGSGTSCCGEGDGYWADESHVRDGVVYAVITDDRPDGQRVHEDIGTEYRVPANKIVGKEQLAARGNPTGHTIIFLAGPSYSQTQSRMQPRPVLCYVMNGGV